jgi:hypothetical protein
MLLEGNCATKPRTPDYLGSSHHLDSPKQYGLDFRGNDPRATSMSVLPSGYRHLLFGQINSESNLVFIKFEEVGAGNGYDQIEHTGHFLKRGHVEGAARREKDIPRAVIDSYRQSIVEHNNSTPTNPVEPLTFENPSTIVRGFYCFLWSAGVANKYTPQVPRICEMLRHLQTNGINPAPFIKACTDARYDEATLNIRTGNEVILNYDEVVAMPLSGAPIRTML